jgi:voltage-gated potassium channel
MTNSRKDRYYRIIFESETPMGKLFDVFLLIFIVISIIAVALESVESVRGKYGEILLVTEWVITIAFTLEYILRIWVVRKPWKYIGSFYGIIDLLAILPTYIGLIVSGAAGLMVIRALRLLRVFRILKLNRYTNAALMLRSAIRSSLTKISVFLFAVLMIVIIVGTLMYLIEGSENGFKDIPTSIYWAIVTLTTVGYGDIAPQTVTGQFLASLVMILGYGIIAVPTGIVTAEMLSTNKPNTGKTCPNCLHEDLDKNDKYCHHCGSELEREE